MQDGLLAYMFFSQRRNFIYNRQVEEGEGWRVCGDLVETYTRCRGKVIPQRSERLETAKHLPIYSVFGFSPFLMPCQLCVLSCFQLNTSGALGAPRL